MTDDSSLYERLFHRVATDDKLSARAGELVLAAFEGEGPLRSAIGGVSPNAAGATFDPPPRPAATEVYLSSVRVQAFRGIGPATTLTLQPGPGLTVITGRNGSGKSSFAEAAELVLTGATTRWSGRTQLLALAVVAEEADHQQATQLWSRLSRAGHHHHYELAPTAAELRAWLDEVRALAVLLDNLAAAPPTTSRSPQAEPRTTGGRGSAPARPRRVNL